MRALQRMVLVGVVVVGGCASTEPAQPGDETLAPASSSAEPVGQASEAPQSASGSHGAVIPEKIAVQPDSERAASGLITIDQGGTISATARDGTAFELVVPPYAVETDVDVTMTPVRDDAMPIDTPVHAVSMEPSGLQFWDFARLTITPTSPIPLERQQMFEASSTGERVRAAQIDPTTEKISVLLQHFSLAGVMQAEAHWTWQAQHSLSRIESLGHEAGRTLHSTRIRELVEGEADTRSEAERLRPFFEAAEKEAAGQMRDAAEHGCEAAAIYIRTLLGLERQRAIVGLSTDETFAAAHAEIDRIRDISFSRCEKIKIEECRLKQDPRVLITFWISWERLRQLQGGVESEAFNEQLPGMAERATRICSGFGLEFSGVSFPLRTLQMGTDTVLDIEGRVDGCPNPDGTVELIGQAQLTYVSDVVGDRLEVRNLFDAIGGQPAHSFEVELSAADTLENHLLLYPRDGNWSRITFGDARSAAPSATLTFINGLDEHVGDFRLAVVAVVPECESPGPTP